MPELIENTEQSLIAETPGFLLELTSELEEALLIETAPCRAWKTEMGISPKSRLYAAIWTFLAIRSPSRTKLNCRSPSRAWRNRADAAEEIDLFSYVP